MSVELTAQEVEAAAMLRRQVAAGAPTIGPGPEVEVEAWVLTADSTGAFLASETPEGAGGPWTARMPGWAGRGGYHAAAEGLLERYGVLDDCHVLHFTGFRPDDAGMPHSSTLLLPCIAVVGAAGEGSGEVLAYRRFPAEGPGKRPALGARPVGRPLYDAKGGPGPHGATERPAPRKLDQLWNCLEHLRHLRDNNDRVAEALDAHWHRVLWDWHAVLGGAGLYGTFARRRDPRPVTEPLACPDGCPRCRPEPAPAGLAALLHEEASCPACDEGRCVECFPTQPPDLPGERGCCCGRLVPA